MALFPVSPAPALPHQVPLNRLLSRAQYSSGAERARVVRSRRLYRASVVYSRMARADLASILDFIADDALTASPFSWVDPSPPDVWKGVYVGVGDGSTLAFNLPSYGAASGTTTVYVAGTPTAITFGSGTGTDSRDKATFAGAPALGALLTVDFTGKLEVWARLSDETSFETVDADLCVLRFSVYEVAV